MALSNELISLTPSREPIKRARNMSPDLWEQIHNLAASIERTTSRQAASALSRSDILVVQSLAVSMWATIQRMVQQNSDGLDFDEPLFSPVGEADDELTQASLVNLLPPQVNLDQQSVAAIAALVSSAGSAKKRRRRRNDDGHPTQCQKCGTTETPEWRRGPDGQYVSFTCFPFLPLFFSVFVFGISQL
eukprot:TRINITY_DN667_c0_g1_i2.p1 TRINITY_DN667_c0_g1~~TRINITY_DN667_c0_g1_i2.p1  ORF type:complete len:205 (+),score=2.91 TRINITY_DN667_c0_g1_i2:49-615(+)